MAHYAILDENNIVTTVIVGKDENETLPEGYTSWEEYYGGKQTSYNTHGGVHRNGGTPFRYNYAAIDGMYDAGADAFIPPKPYPSWLLDSKTYTWKSPIPYPQDGKKYWWFENSGTWIEARLS
jgi:hypothetical protein